MLALHDTVALPEPVTPLGVIVPQVRPGGIVSVKVTVPAKWLMAFIVMVDVAEEPALRGEGDDEAIPKSWTWKTGEAA